MVSRPHFERSISLNDLDSSAKVREHIQQDIITPEDGSKHSFLKSASQFTFALRSFKDFHVDYKKFLYSYLVDFVVYRELEECRRLNWCDGLFPMVPILTMGDGNCLMHAASVGMWAVSDRYHILRKLVYNALLEDVNGFYHKRWQRELEVSNLSCHGYKMTEEQWTREWEIVLELVSQNEYPLGNNGMRFSSLEEIHIFVLANVLRRTIIIISNDVQRGNYDEPLTPLNFPGIYLPLKWDPVDCVKTPLVIGYSQGHFSAIASFQDGVFDRGEVSDGSSNLKIHGVPLEHSDGKCLPVHFLFEDEVDISDGLLRQYLDCTKVIHRDLQKNKDCITLAAKLHFVKPPGCIAELVDGFFSSAQETYKIMVQRKYDNPNSQTPSLHLEKCKTKGCEFYGTYETLYLCSKCLDRHLKETPGGQGEGLGTVPNNAEGNCSTEQEKLQEGNQKLQVQQQQLFEQSQQQQQQQVDKQQKQQLQQNHQQQGKIMDKRQELTQKKCATIGCKYDVASTENGNFCRRCYESDVLSREQNAKMASIGMALCANSINGCEFFGIPQQEGFCSKCYERFCSNMQSLSTEDKNATKGQNSMPLTQEKRCQTEGCPRPGCADLYDRCVECYSDCIKLFIYKSEGETKQAISAAAVVSKSPLPPPPKLCIIYGCQNEGKVEHGGNCQACYRVLQNVSPLDTQQGEMTSNREPELTLNQPSPHDSLLYCGSPMCEHPLGETNGTLCTNCIMTKFQLERKTPPLSGDKELQKTKRRDEVLRARQRLPRLCIPPRHGEQSVRNTAEARTMRNSSIEAGVSGAGGAGAPASGIHCLTPNCPFHANSETQFLCTSCHDKEKKEWEKINKMTQRRRPEPRLELRYCAFDNCYQRESPGNNMGLCDKCFQTAVRNERVWDLENRRRQPREPQRQQPIVPQKSSSRKAKSFVNAGAPCNSPGCLKFGTTDKDGYCDRCFEKQQRRVAVGPSPPPESASLNSTERERLRQRRNSPPILHEPVSVSQPQSRVFGEGSGFNPNICIQEGCRMTGDVYLGGYCSKCFEDYTKERCYTESISDLTSQEPPSIDYSINSELTSTGLTGLATLPPTSPRTYARPMCNKQVQSSTMSHCRDCIVQLYPQYAPQLIRLESHRD